MASQNVEQLTRESVLRASSNFLWNKKMPKWTVMVEGRELPARPLVLAAAGVNPNDPTNSHMAVAKLKALGFETRYEGHPAAIPDSERFDIEFFDSGVQYHATGRWAARRGLLPVCGNLYHHAIEMFLK